MSTSGSSEDLRPGYFMPGEIVLLVEYGPGLGIGQVKNAVRQLLADRQDLRLEFDDQRILTFATSRDEDRRTDPARTRESFALVFTTLEGFDARKLIGDEERWTQADRDLLQRIDALNAAESERVYAVEPQRDEKQVDTVVLNKIDIRPHGPLPDTGFRMSAAAPNWLMSSAQGGQIPTGGPGAMPVPDATLATSASINAGSRLRHTFALPSQIQEQMTDQAQKMQEVDVAILDTAPSSAAFKAAYEQEWWSKNPVLQALGLPGDSNRDFQITYLDELMPLSRGQGAGRQNEWVDLWRDHYQVRQHAYPMPDHGLFVAGIIRTLAPTVRLHLLQVLNDYGVGTLQSLAAGLHYLASKRRSSVDVPLIINMSLTLATPRDNAHEHPDRPLTWNSLSDIHSRALQRICNQLDLHNAVLVGAAGNDGREGQAPPQARLPAGFASVVGVGALKKDGNPAPYSNQADAPMKTGIVTFGGDVSSSAAAPTADPEKGILGVYLGEFPGGEANTGGWARWAGTSFATPVISGVLASLCAQGRQADEAQQTLMVACAAGGQHILAVAQG